MLKTTTLSSLRRRHLSVLTLGLVITSCSREAAGPKDEATSYIVTESQARQVAENIYTSSGMLGQRIAQKTLHLTQSVFTTKQRIAAMQVLAAQDGKPAVYMFNYEQGGYAIVAADRHMLPVLAFNTVGSMPTSDAGPIAGAWLDWVGTTQAVTAALRQHPEAINEAYGAATAWRMVVDSPLSEADAEAYVQRQIAVEKPSPLRVYSPAARLLPEDPPPSDPPTVQRGPFVQSTWGQSTPYNAQCIDQRTNRLCYTGCVPTAMAQILRYWQFGNAYNWSQMDYTDRTQGQPETARLMKDIGDDIGTQRNPMPSECGTDAHRMATSFRDHFGYQHADFHDYPEGASGTNVYTSYWGSGTSSYLDVKGQLDYSIPVIFGASTDQAYRGPWLHEGSGDNHAFVCDGYLASYYQGNGYLYFHMNWGEDSMRHDGWYQYNNWVIRAPDGSTIKDYHYDKEVTINITPY